MGVAPNFRGLATVPASHTADMGTGVLQLRIGREGQPLAVLVCEDPELAFELNAFAAALPVSQVSALRHSVLPDLAWLLEADDQGWLYKDNSCHALAKVLCDSLAKVAETHDLPHVAAAVAAAASAVREAEEMIKQLAVHTIELDELLSYPYRFIMGLKQRTEEKLAFDQWRWANEIRPNLSSRLCFTLALAWIVYHAITTCRTWIHIRPIEEKMCDGLSVICW